MEDHGIVIGIERYPGISDLKGPCNDAERFHDWLVDPARGGVDPANVEMIRSTDFPEPTSVDDAHPVLSEISTLFRPHAEKAAQHEHTDGRLFIFAAGHGFADPQNMETSALYSAEASLLWSTHLAVNGYAQFLRRHYAFSEIILIVDSCRSTLPMQRVVDPPHLPELAPHPQARRAKFFRAFAQFGEVARERPFNGEVRGIFTEMILDALEKAEPNRLGRVTGSIVKEHVHNSIKRIAGNDDVEPPEIYAESNRDVLFLTRETQAADLAIVEGGVETIFATQDHHLGQTLLFETGTPARKVGRKTIAGSPMTLSIRPGIYKVIVEETRQSTLFEVPGNAIVSL